MDPQRARQTDQRVHVMPQVRPFRRITHFHLDSIRNAALGSSILECLDGSRG